MNRIDLLIMGLRVSFIVYLVSLSWLLEDPHKYLKRMSSFSIPPSRKLENHLLADFPVHSKLFGAIVRVVLLGAGCQRPLGVWTRWLSGCWDLKEHWIFEHAREGLLRAGAGTWTMLGASMLIKWTQHCPQPHSFPGSILSLWRKLCG